jgi:hypothetical protein
LLPHIDMCASPIFHERMIFLSAPLTLFAIAHDWLSTVTNR